MGENEAIRTLKDALSGRLTTKRTFDDCRPGEEVNALCVNGYTVIIDPIVCPFCHDVVESVDEWMVGEAVDKLAEYEEAEENGEWKKVVHGRWIDKGRKIECSVCGGRVYLGTDDPGLHKEEKQIHKFCQLCGAKMDLWKEGIKHE